MMTYYIMRRKRDQQGDLVRKDGEVTSKIVADTVLAHTGYPKLVRRARA